jgi:hypothetical protein
VQQNKKVQRFHRRDTAKLELNGQERKGKTWNLQIYVETKSLEF